MNCSSTDGSKSLSAKDSFTFQIITVFSDMILLGTDLSVPLTKPINSLCTGNSGCFSFFFKRMVLVLINLIFVTWALFPIWQSPKPLRRLMPPHSINEAERVRMSSPLTEMHSNLGGTPHPLKSVITCIGIGPWGMKNPQLLWVKYWSYSNEVDVIRSWSLSGSVLPKPPMGPWGCWETWHSWNVGKWRKFCWYSLRRTL